MRLTRAPRHALRLRALEHGVEDLAVAGAAADVAAERDLRLVEVGCGRSSSSFAPAISMPGMQ